MATVDEIKGALESSFVRTTSGGIRVGMENIQDLVGLSQLLDQKFKKLIERYGTLEEAIIHESQQNSKNQKIEQDKRDLKEDKRNKDLIKALKQKDDESKKSLMGYSTFLNILSKIRDGFVKLSVNQLDYVETLRDMTSSGVVLSNGFQSLSATAIEAGQTSEEFAKRLSSVAPTLAKLNATVGNGAKVYAENFKNLREFGLSNDEMQNAITSAINKLTPAQLREMEQHNTLSDYIKQTTKRMIELRDATGKSIETINQETDVKNRELRLQAWAKDPKNQRTYDMLTQLGLNDADTVDFLRTGIPTEKIALAMAGNKDVAYLLNNLRAIMASGQELTPEIIAQLKQEMITIYNEAQQRRQNRAESNAIYAGAGANTAFETYGFSNKAEGIMSFGSEVKRPEEDTKLLADSNEVRAFIEALKESANEFMRGGYDNVKNSMSIAGETSKKLNETFGTIIPDGLKKLNEAFSGSGAIAATIAGGFGEAIISGIVSYLGDKIMGKAGKVVSKVFTKKTTGKKVRSKAPRKTTKLQSVSKTPKAKIKTPKAKVTNIFPKAGAKISKFGKLAKGVPGAGIISSSLGAYDLYSNWDDIKESGTVGTNIGSTVGSVIGATLGSALGPIGAIAGSWAGEKAGSWLGEKADKWFNSKTSNSENNTKYTEEGINTNKKDKSGENETNKLFDNIIASNDKNYQCMKDIDDKLEKINAVMNSFLLSTKLKPTLSMTPITSTTSN